MAEEKYLEALELGKEAWNIWYKAKSSGPADLKGANLACTDLAGINLAGAILEMADLRYADLTGADLTGADLSGAKMARAILRGANLLTVKGLTPEQIHEANGDADTVLPIGMRPPAHWCVLEDALAGVRRSGAHSIATQVM